MQPGTAEKLSRYIEALFREKLTKLKSSLRQGLPVKEYQVQEATCKALVNALGILETFYNGLDKYCADDSVKQCLNIIQARNEKEWKDLPENERLQRMLAGIGFLGADMGLPDEAEALFDILALLAPDNVHPLLGTAYIKLTTGSAHEALEVIQDKVLNKAPGNDLGLAFLALTYANLSKTREALAAATAVITANRDAPAVELAIEVQQSLAQPVG